MFVCPFNCTLANIYTVYKLAPPESMQTSIHPVPNVRISSHVIVWNLTSESAPRAFCQQIIPENFNRINVSPYFVGPDIPGCCKDFVCRPLSSCSCADEGHSSLSASSSSPTTHLHVTFLHLLVNTFNLQQKGADASCVWIYLFQCVPVIIFV